MHKQQLPAHRSLAYAAALFTLLVFAIPGCRAQSTTNINLAQLNTAQLRPNLRSITRLNNMHISSGYYSSPYRNIGGAQSAGAWSGALGVRDHAARLVSPAAVISIDQSEVENSSIGKAAGLLGSGKRCKRSRTCGVRSAAIPVAFLAPATAPRPQPLGKVDLDSCVVRCLGPCQASLDTSGALLIPEGETLIEAVKSTQARLGSADLVLEAGAIVMSFRSGDHVCVRNLYDRHRHSVLLRQGAATLDLKPGEEAILAESHGVAQRAKVEHLCDRRRCTSLCAVDGVETQLSEVSIPSLIKSNELLQHVYYSQEKADRRLTDRLVKISACLAHCSRNHGEFSWQTEEGPPTRLASGPQSR